MKVMKPIIGIILLAVLTYAGEKPSQSRYAKFNTTREQVLGNIDKAEFKIKGELLTTQNDTIKVVPTRNSADTVFYRKNKKEQWNFFLCRILPSCTYHVYANACCEGYRIRKESCAHQIGLYPGDTGGKLIGFTLKGKTSKRYIGTIWEKIEYSYQAICMGTSVKSGKVSYITTCHEGPSTYGTNIFTVCLHEIENDTSLNALDGGCVCFQKGKRSIEEYRYKFAKTVTTFDIAMLDDKPLIFTYDADSNKVYLR
jgi:hypothetical protein